MISLNYIFPPWGGIDSDVVSMKIFSAMIGEGGRGGWRGELKVNNLRSL